MSESDNLTGSETIKIDEDHQSESSQPALVDANIDSLNSEELNDGHQYGTVTTNVDDSFRGGSSPSNGHEYGQTEDKSGDQFNAIKHQDKPRQEPEKILRWREEQKERLLKKDAGSEKKKAEWREIAKRELEDWYRHRDELLEKSKKVNREAQDAFVEDRDKKSGGGGGGSDWERICRLCDFNPKGSRNSKDVSRMRSILLQLKQTPSS